MARGLKAGGRAPRGQRKAEVRSSARRSLCAASLAVLCDGQARARLNRSSRIIGRDPSRLEPRPRCAVCSRPGGGAVSSVHRAARPDGAAVLPLPVRVRARPSTCRLCCVRRARRVGTARRALLLSAVRLERLTHGSPAVMRAWRSRRQVPAVPLLLRPHQVGLRQPVPRLPHGVRLREGDLPEGGGAAQGRSRASASRAQPVAASGAEARGACCRTRSAAGAACPGGRRAAAASAGAAPGHPCGCSWRRPRGAA
jgi:hypothetical protein